MEEESARTAGAAGHVGLDVDIQGVVVAEELLQAVARHGPGEVALLLMFVCVCVVMSL